jgi:hypothetical protein
VDRSPRTAEDSRVGWAGGPQPSQHYTPSIVGTQKHISDPTATMEQKLVTGPDLTNLNPSQRAIALAKRIVKQPAPNACEFPSTPPSSTVSAFRESSEENLSSATGRTHGRGQPRQM